MSLKPITITFSDSITDEARTLLVELKVASIIRAVRQGKELDKVTLQDLERLLNAIVDLLDPKLPAINKDPFETLRLISRDNNLARLLSNRSAVRLFRFLRQKDDDGVPLFMSLTTEDGEVFPTQNDFIDYLCKQAHISRSSLFERKKILERLIHLGYTLEKAYYILVSKPRTIGNVLNEFGDWDDNKLVDVDPLVISKICDKISPEQTEPIMELLAQAEANDELTPGVRQKLFPVFQELLEEVVVHDSATEAMDFVKHDVLCAPEIGYRWDPESDSLLVDFIQKEIDPDGSQYVARVLTIAYQPQFTAVVPKEVRDDLIRRLPIKNRRYLDD